MTDLRTAPTQDSRAARAKKPGPPLSALAVAAFVSSAVLCCPLASIVGAALAMFALARVKRSGGALGGRRLAFAALFIAAGGLLGQAILFERFLGEYWRRLDASMRGSTESLIVAAQRDDLAGAQAVWSAQAPTRDEIQAFGAALRERYGDFHGLSIVAHDPGGTVSQPTITVALLAQFEHRELTGSATYLIAPMYGSVFAEATLMEIEIDDPEGGALKLGGG